MLIQLNYYNTNTSTRISNKNTKSATRDEPKNQRFIFNPTTAQFSQLFLRHSRESRFGVKQNTVRTGAINTSFSFEIKAEYRIYIFDLKCL